MKIILPEDEEYNKFFSNFLCQSALHQKSRLFVALAKDRNGVLKMFAKDDYPLDVLAEDLLKIHQLLRSPENIKKIKPE